MPSTPICSLRAAQVLRFLCTACAAEGTLCFMRGPRLLALIASSHFLMSMFIAFNSVVTHLHMHFVKIKITSN